MAHSVAFEISLCSQIVTFTYAATPAVFIHNRIYYSQLRGTHLCLSHAMELAVTRQTSTFCITFHRMFYLAKDNVLRRLGQMC